MVKYTSRTQLFQFFLNSFSNFHHRGQESALFSSVSMWLPFTTFHFGKYPNIMGRYASRAKLFQFFLNSFSNFHHRGPESALLFNSFTNFRGVGEFFKIWF